MDVYDPNYNYPNQHTSYGFARTLRRQFRKFPDNGKNYSKFSSRRSGKSTSSRKFSRRFRTFKQNPEATFVLTSAEEFRNPEATGKLNFTFNFNLKDLKTDANYSKAFEGYQKVFDSFKVQKVELEMFLTNNDSIAKPSVPLPRIYWAYDPDNGNRRATSSNIALMQNSKMAVLVPGKVYKHTLYPKWYDVLGGNTTTGATTSGMNAWFDIGEDFSQDVYSYNGIMFAVEGGSGSDSNNFMVVRHTVYLRMKGKRNGQQYMSR